MTTLLDAALADLVTAYSAKQRADAFAMIAAGALTETPSRGFYQVRGSDKVTVYLTHELECSCPRGLAGQRCKHRLAVAMREAHRRLA